MASDPGQRRLPLQQGAAAVLAYSSISALWYLAGMTLYLSTTSAQSTSLNAAALRLGKAWVITFAGSQVTTPWRAAGAAVTAPVLNSAFCRLRDGFGLKRTLLPALAYAVTVCFLFGAGLVGLVARELLLSR